MFAVQVIGRPGGPGTSKRKAIVLDDMEDEEDRDQKGLKEDIKERDDSPKITEETARRLAALRVSRDTFCVIAIN